MAEKVWIRKLTIEEKVEEIMVGGKVKEKYIKKSVDSKVKEN